MRARIGWESALARRGSTSPAGCLAIGAPSPSVTIESVTESDPTEGRNESQALRVVISDGHDHRRLRREPYEGFAPFLRRLHRRLRLREPGRHTSSLWPRGMAAAGTPFSTSHAGRVTASCRLRGRGFEVTRLRPLARDARAKRRARRRTFLDRGRHAQASIVGGVRPRHLLRRLAQPPAGRGRPGLGRLRSMARNLARPGLLLFDLNTLLDLPHDVRLGWRGATGGPDVRAARRVQPGCPAWMPRELAHRGLRGARRRVVRAPQHSLGPASLSTTPSHRGDRRCGSRVSRRAWRAGRRLVLAREGQSMNATPSLCSTRSVPAYPAAPRREPGGAGGGGVGQPGVSVLDPAPAARASRSARRRGSGAASHARVAV